MPEQRTHAAVIEKETCGKTGENIGQITHPRSQDMEERDIYEEKEKRE